jgi:hypothetical protein
MGLDPTSGNAKTFLIVGVLIVLGFGIYSGVKALDLLPGFNGETNGLYGEQPQNTGQVVTLGNPFPNIFGVTYNWVGSPNIASASIKASDISVAPCTLFNGVCTDMLVMDTQTNPVSTGALQKVSYYVPINATTSHVVNGQVQSYTFTTDISVQSGSDGTWNFGSDTIWSTLVPQDFNSDQAPNVYEIPLYAVVTGAQWHDQGSSGCDACIVGHSFSFYSTPSTTGQTLALLQDVSNNPTTTNINSSLAATGNPLPDTRFPASGLVYYPITLINFRANPLIGGDCTFTCTYPTVHLTITLYTLRERQYLVPNPDTTGLGGRSQSCVGISCISDAFSNLANWIATNPILAGLIATLGVGLVVVLILAVFATPVIVAIIYVLGRKKST